MDGVSGDAGPSLQPVEPGYRHVLRARLLLLWLPLVIGGSIFARVMLAETPFFAPAVIALLVIAVLAVALAPQRIYRRLLYGLTDRQLQVLRGWLFHSDTIVPFVRVQHLDVTRGPLDKLFGTATMVVHTAGTRNSIVTVPGLAPQRAAEIRDIIRQQIRTDFA